MDKIFITKIDKVLKEYDSVSTVDWHGNELVIKRAIGLDDVVLFISNVVDACFADIDNGYSPEFKDFAIRYNIISMYTNLKLPDDMGHRYKILYLTDIIDVVMAKINMHQFNDIMRAIDDKIDAKIYTNNEMFELKINSAIEQIATLSQTIASLFEGVDEEDIKNMVNAISNGKLDEEKLVDAIVNTKVHAEKSDDIVNAKGDEEV